MTAKRAAFVYSPQLEQYKYPAEHPLSTIRAKQTRQLAESMGLLSGGGMEEVPPEPADPQVLQKIHTARYLQTLQRASNGQLDAAAAQVGLGTEDCPVFAGFYDYALLATGASLVGTRLILSGDADVAFNPSGGYHHAFPERAAGFCYLNDVALACAVLAEAGKRVLYLDVDAHHGDGVAAAFYQRADVMTVSLHQDPRTIFPGTGFENEIGIGSGHGYCVNVPLPVGTYDQAYLTAFEGLVVPLIKAYQPDAFVFELGADALAGDPLAKLSLTNNVYVEVIQQVSAFGKPIMMTGGGGYHVENTVRAWTLAWSVLCGEDEAYDPYLGLGGVMLESTEWQGGLRDRALPVTAQQRNSVEPALARTIEIVKGIVFPLHGLATV